ncbi:alpha/beta hydrolase-fold protein [Singulisphaera sp. Ch08]|uniref:Alpha/beta hydrolase-fold protein n=1 Tax=Singulisphaera sp. Ch08 TaxID=3120278 RepID=A0AAU7C8G7_9BACT
MAKFRGFGLVLIAASTALADERPPLISEARRNEQGVLIHSVESPYQAGSTEIRVLLPDAREKDALAPVIYLLPVEARNEHRYGDALAEVQRLELHNQLGVIFISPTFSELPWYADHPTKRQIRQESHFIKVVVPFVEATYPAQRSRDGRLLLGFSKSGWGAWSLLLRHPDLFGKAAAWDAPLMMDRPGQYGSGEIFGTTENFEGYRITNLLKRRADDAEFGPRNRLILLGYDNFRAHHEQAHTLMLDLRMPHVYRDGPKQAHAWDGGWVRAAAELLRNEAR